MVEGVGMRKGGMEGWRWRMEERVSEGGTEGRREVKR